MATKKEIHRRQETIKKYIESRVGDPPTFDEIAEYLSRDNSFAHISDITIKRDLKELKIICNRTDSTYYLKTTKMVNTIEKNINILLKKCILYKPVKIGFPLVIQTPSNDTNPSLELFAIVITTTNTTSPVLEELTSKISKLYKVNPSLSEIGNLYLHKETNLIQYVFSDLDNLLNFYNNLISIQSNNYTKKR